MRVALVGIGRMGRAIEEIARSRGHEIVARIVRGVDLIEALRAAGPEIALEFTNPDQAGANVARLVDLRVPTVSGTTGWDSGPALARADALGTPCLVAPNFSIGMAVARSLASDAARLLAPFPDFEPGIFERHHSKKIDRPSGSARMLAAAVGGAIAGMAPDDRTGTDPAAVSGAGAGPVAPSRDVPIAALRQGSQPGVHEVIFDGPDEEVAIVHRVRSRSDFATGAVLAAEWIVRARPRGAVRFEDFLERSRT